MRVAINYVPESVICMTVLSAFELTLALPIAAVVTDIALIMSCLHKRVVVMASIIYDTQIINMTVYMKLSSDFNYQ